MALNTVTYQGNLTKNPERAQTKGETTIVNFTVANTRRYAQKEETCFLDCVVYGKTADNVLKYFQKGQQIIVEGRLTQNQWQDKQGNNRSKIVLTLTGFHFCGQSQKQGGQNQGGGQQNQQQSNQGGGYQNNQSNGGGYQQDNQGQNQQNNNQNPQNNGGGQQNQQGCNNSIPF